MLVIFKSSNLKYGRDELKMKRKFICVLMAVAITANEGLCVKAVENEITSETAITNLVENEAKTANKEKEKDVKTNEVEEINSEPIESISKTKSRSWNY